jgi:hypothetical protein
MPSADRFRGPLRQGASVTASILETAAGALRSLADADERDDEAPAAAAPPPAAATGKPRPPAGTRSHIANPKAARKVRSRER